MEFVKSIEELYGKKENSKMLRDLNAQIPGAPNFKYGELVRSDAANRFGILNLHL